MRENDRDLLGNQQATKRRKGNTELKVRKVRKGRSLYPKCEHRQSMRSVREMKMVDEPGLFTKRRRIVIYFKGNLFYAEIL